METVTAYRQSFKEAKKGVVHLYLFLQDKWNKSDVKTITGNFRLYSPPSWSLNDNEVNHKVYKGATHWQKILKFSVEDKKGDWFKISDYMNWHAYKCFSFCNHIYKCFLKLVAHGYLEVKFTKQCMLFRFNGYPIKGQIG